MDRAEAAQQALSITVEHSDGASTSTVVPVRLAVNFGYAARDERGVLAHVEEMQELGVAAPKRVPTISLIPPDRVTTSTAHTVSGDQTYGEVEFALINTPQLGWIVTVACDHTDLEFEAINMAKAKASAPDVIASTAWRVSDVEDHWDDLELTLIGVADDGSEVVIQDGSTSDLLAPSALIAELESRAGRSADEGTVILSGTISGKPTPGFRTRRAELRDPRMRRKVTLTYSIAELQEAL